MRTQLKEGFLINHFVENLITVKTLERLSRECIYTGPWINQFYMLSKTWHNFLTPVRTQSLISFDTSDFMIVLTVVGRKMTPQRFVAVLWSPRCVWLFATPWTAACQASLYLTIFQSLPKFMSIEFVMPSKPSHPLTPKDAYILRFKTCEHITLHGKRDF